MRKSNGAVANSGDTNILYTIKRLAVRGILSLSVFSHLSKRRIFQFLLSYKFYDLETFHSKIVVLECSPKFAKKPVLLSIISILNYF